MVEIYFGPPRRLSGLPNARLVGVAFVKNNSTKTTVGFEMRVRAWTRWKDGKPIDLGVVDWEKAMADKLITGEVNYTLEIEVEDVYEALHLYKALDEFLSQYGKKGGLYKSLLLKRLHASWDINGGSWPRVLEEISRVLGSEWREALKGERVGEE